MSINKLREAGKLAFPKDTKPTLRLIRASSECSTPDYALNATREVKEMLRDLNRKQNVMKENDAPEAA